MIPKTVETSSYLISHSSYIGRGVLYFSIATLAAAVEFLPSPYRQIAICLGAGLLAVRAYIDKSPAQVESGPMKTASDSDADSDNKPGETSDAR